MEMCDRWKFLIQALKSQRSTCPNLSFTCQILWNELHSNWVPSFIGVFLKVKWTLRKAAQAPRQGQLYLNQSLSSGDTIRFTIVWQWHNVWLFRLHLDSFGAFLSKSYCAVSVAFVAPSTFVIRLHFHTDFMRQPQLVTAIHCLCVC